MQTLRACVLTEGSALTMRTAFVVVLVMIALPGPAHVCTAAQADGGLEPGWVALVKGELVGWLENENRIDELCKRDGPDTDWKAFDACRDEKLAPKTLQIPVRESPSRDAPAIGSIIVVADPGDGLDAFALTGQSGVGVRFVPDEYDRDWGYGPPHFHQTFLERRGTWFRLPVNPFAGPVWVDVAEWSAESDRPEVLHVAEGGVYESPKGDLFVLGVERDVLVARAEQEADMWCQAGEPPPVQSSPEWRIPWSELYDTNRHLALHLKYKRGC